MHDAGTTGPDADQNAGTQWQQPAGRAQHDMKDRPWRRLGWAGSAAMRLGVVLTVCLLCMDAANLRCIAIHPTLPVFLTSSDDTLIKLWDWDKGFVCVQQFEGHSHFVMQVRRPLGRAWASSACMGGGSRNGSAVEGVQQREFKRVHAWCKLAGVVRSQVACAWGAQPWTQAVGRASCSAASNVARAVCNRDQQEQSTTGSKNRQRWQAVCVWGGGGLREWGGWWGHGRELQP